MVLMKHLGKGDISMRPYGVWKNCCVCSTNCAHVGGMELIHWGGNGFANKLI